MIKGLITAGGRGTRMQPLTFSTNKHFIPIANKPLIFYAIETLIEAGIREIAINYNPGQLEELKSYLGTGRKFGVKFTYLLQERPAGLADIVRIAQDFVGRDKLVMHLGDNIFWGGIKELVAKFESSREAAMLIMIKHPENFRMGVPYFDSQNRLVKVVEKPKRPPHQWAIPGLYFFTPLVFKCFRGRDQIRPSARGELEITSIYNWLLRHNYQVGVLEFSGVWRDPGKFDDWLATNQFILDCVAERKIESALDRETRIEGRVLIGPNCQIKKSLIRGPVIIGSGVKIINSFIGPYSSIGDGCQLINTRLENSVLLQGVKIENLDKLLDSSLIGQESSISSNGFPNNTFELFIGNRCQLKL